MKCPNCGNEVSPKAVQCKRCGMILPGTSYTQTNPRIHTANRNPYSSMSGLYTEHIVSQPIYQAPYPAGQPYRGQTYVYQAPAQTFVPGGYPPENASGRERGKDLLYSRILTTLLGLHVVLDLLLIIVLLIR